MPRTHRSGRLAAWLEEREIDLLASAIGKAFGGGK